jgi:putative membrane protein
MKRRLARTTIAALAAGLAWGVAGGGAILGPGTALAQRVGGPDGASPQAPKMTAETFAQSAANAQRFEMESAKLALAKSQNPAVRAYAERMLRDHKAASDKLASALKDSGGAAAPSPRLDALGQQFLDQLQRTDDGQFDHLYMQTQAQMHQQALNIGRSYSLSGDNGSLKTFASEMMSQAQAERDDARKLDATLSKS